MAAAVSPGRQRLDGDYSAKVALDKARRITVYLNGDPNFMGAQMLVNRRQIRTWEAFLNASTQKTGVLTAVRYIATPETGTHLADLEELRDKQSYVAITRGKFKPIGYTTLSERRKQYLEGNVHRTSAILKIKPVEHSHIQVPGKIAKIPIRSVMINVFVNGKSFDAPYRIALSPKTMQSWKLVLKEIEEHIRGLVPKALYTIDGTRIITQSADLESGGKYVIVGNEPGGFRPYSYGVFNRARQHKKLPPIKLKRRFAKKLMDRDFSSSFQENPAEGTSGRVSQRTAQSIESKLPEVTVLDVESSIERSLVTKPSSSTPKRSSPVQRTASERLESDVIRQHSSTTRAEKTKSAGEIEVQDSSALTSKESAQNVEVKPSESSVHPVSSLEKLLSTKSLTKSTKINLNVIRVNSENFDRVPSPVFKMSEHSKSKLLVIPEIEPKTEQFPEEKQTAIESEYNRQEFSVASTVVEEEQTVIQLEDNYQEFSIASIATEEEQTAMQHEDNRQEDNVASIAVEEEQTAIQLEDNHQDFSVASIAVEEEQTAIQLEDIHEEHEMKASLKTAGSVSSHNALESAEVKAEENVGEFDNTTDTNVEENRLATEVTVEEIGQPEKVAEEEKAVEKEIEVEQTEQNKEENSNIRTAIPSRSGVSPWRTESSEEQQLSDDSPSSETKVWIKT